LDWAIHRDTFNKKATEIRQRFDANRGASPAAAARMLQVSIHVALKTLFVLAWMHLTVYYFTFRLVLIIASILFFFDHAVRTLRLDE
jgi:uncharacterized membrane protein